MSSNSRVVKCPFVVLAAAAFLLLLVREQFTLADMRTPDVIALTAQEAQAVHAE